MLGAGLCPGWERDSAVLGTAGDEGKEVGMERNAEGIGEGTRVRMGVPSPRPASLSLPEFRGC